MPTFVALLRAVNVGGKHPVVMADLRALCEDAGCGDVTTYVQSGNVVFSHPKVAAKKLEADLERRIQAATGFDVPVMLRSAAESAAVVRNNPFDGIEPSKLHVAFLKDAPARRDFESLDAAKYAPEAAVLVKREVYLLLPNGMAKTKLPAALRVLKTPATVRNWRTVLKLSELAAG